MTFTDWIASFIGTFFGNSVLFAIIIFLAKNTVLERIKNSIKHEYDKELETHKADLKRDYDVQVEKLKAELAQQHHRFSHIFKGTADVVVSTYQKLLELGTAAETFFAQHGNQNKESAEAGDDLYKKRGEFHKYFRLNEIFLEETTATSINHFVHTLFGATNKYGLFFTLTLYKANPENTMKLATESTKEMYEEVPKLLAMLKNDFRKILGVTPEDDKTNVLIK